MKSWNELKEWSSPKSFKPEGFLSIIIPARNEEKNIELGLKSLAANKYPKDKYEIILIDDHSEDKTYEIAKSLHIENLTIIKQDEGKQGKKQALKKGIARAKGELILTTDADCIYHRNWLRCMISFYENHQAKLLTGPIQFTPNNNFLQRFQALDLIGLMAVTASGIQTERQFMANGCNMVFSKAIFDEVGGYRGNEHLASGDDMFLVHKFAEKYPEDIYFVKSEEAIVKTKAEPTLRTFLSQRKRWATKTVHYTDKRLIFLLGMVFLFSISILLNLFILSFFNSFYLLIGLFQLSIKLIIDYLFLSNVSQFFRAKKVLDEFFPSNILYLFYILYSGVSGLFGGKYSWKGRTIS